MKKYSIDKAERTIVTKPAPRPPYPEPNMTATKQREKTTGSALDGMADAKPRATAAAKIAIVYRTHGGRSSMNIRSHQWEKALGAVVDRSEGVINTGCTFCQ